MCFSKPFYVESVCSPEPEESLLFMTAEACSSSLHSPVSAPSQPCLPAGREHVWRFPSLFQYSMMSGGNSAL